METTSTRHILAVEKSWRDGADWHASVSRATVNPGSRNALPVAYLSVAARYALRHVTEKIVSLRFSFHMLLVLSSWRLLTVTVQGGAQVGSGESKASVVAQLSGRLDSALARCMILAQASPDESTGLQRPNRACVGL